MALTRWAFLASVSLAGMSFCTSAYPQEGCDAYPLIDGIGVEETTVGPKIMSTASVAVLLDDQAEVIDALKEATLVATSQIAEFLNTTIQSDQILEKAVDTQIQIVGDETSVSKETIKTQLTSVRSSSSAFIKGVVKLAECYTKGKYVSVTVGVKPETISGAEGLAQQISDGVGESERSSDQNVNAEDGVASFSITIGLDKF